MTILLASPRSGVSTILHDFCRLSRHVSLLLVGFIHVHRPSLNPIAFLFSLYLMHSSGFSDIPTHLVIYLFLGGLFFFIYSRSTTLSRFLITVFHFAFSTVRTQHFLSFYADSRWRKKQNLSTNRYTHTRGRPRILRNGDWIGFGAANILSFLSCITLSALQASRFMVTWIFYGFSWNLETAEIGFCFIGSKGWYR